MNDVFATGYIGFRVQPQDFKERFENDLKRLRSQLNSPTNSFDFCRQIAEVLTEIPDNHLEVYSGKRSCGIAQSMPSSPVNVAHKQSSKSFWIIETFNVNRRIVPVVGILRFPDPNDTGWYGFKSKFLQAMQSPAIIFDMRGNSGRHIGMAQWIAESLGESVLSPWLEAKDLETPAARAIFRNGFILSAKRYTDSGEAIPEWLKRQIDEPLPESSESIRVLERRRIKNPRSPYKGLIIIMTDRACGSTCEAFVLLMKQRENTSVVGESTSGTFSYGNAGALVLPASRILIQMPTRAFIQDPRFFEEKRGIIPDVQVSRDNALEAALGRATR